MVVSPVIQLELKEVDELERYMQEEKVDLDQLESNIQNENKL